MSDRAVDFLDAMWSQTQADKAIAAGGTVPDAVHRDIQAAINSRTKSYRYVLPTQLLAKHEDPAGVVQVLRGRC